LYQGSKVFTFVIIFIILEVFMIDVQHLTQVYKSGKGIFDVSFSVGKGEVFGFLGPNGAGKTTTIRNLMGFVNVDKGRALINGKDCRSETAELQALIGYLPGEMAFFDNMRGTEFLKFLGNMRGLQSWSLRDTLIERFQLDPSGSIRKMSKGMKQKLGIVAAFMHDPQVYILDEPTAGLDPFMQNVFMDLILGEKKRGKTILMSSHIFEEVQRSCDRAGIIRNGKLVAIEDVRSLNNMKQSSYVVTLDSKKQADILMKCGLPCERLKDRQVLIQIKQDFDLFFDILSKFHVKGLDQRRQSLEDIFMNYYGEEADDE
jgi:ABC-2 type transport system ATP-binding protein